MKVQNAKCALVTGAAVGIGRGIALALAESGYDVGIHCNGSRQKAEELREEICAMGRKCGVYPADVRDCTQIDRLFGDFQRDFGRLDLFVANAGVTKKAAFLEMDEDTFDLVTQIDFRGTFFCVQRAARAMRDSQTRGSIVIISSNNAFMQTPGVACYGSVKDALVKLTKHAAMEVAQYGIRVNAIAPGWTDTGESRLPPKETTYGHIPLKRWCQPAEIGQAVLALSANWAGSITGSCLVMDGGASAQTHAAEEYGL